MLNLGCLTVVMGEVTNNQQYYMTWKMEESRLVELSRMTMEYSKPEESVLLHKFHKWQKDVAEQESLNGDSENGIKEMVIDEDKTEGEGKEVEGKEDEGEEDGGKEGEAA